MRKKGEKPKSSLDISKPEAMSISRKQKLTKRRLLFSKLFLSNSFGEK